MSLIIKDGDDLQYVPIHAELHKDKWEVRSLDSIPQQARDCPLKARTIVCEKYHDCISLSSLPGVELRNIWVYIEGKTMTIYAGVTGRKQRNGEYRYTEEVIGGIRKEITLPEWVPQRPKTAAFLHGALFVVFPREIEFDIDPFSESLWDLRRH